MIKNEILQSHNVQLRDGLRFDKSILKRLKVLEESVKKDTLTITKAGPMFKFVHRFIKAVLLVFFLIFTSAVVITRIYRACYR